jgi:hypothetical protein
MKSFILSIICAFFLLTAQGQGSFAPVGAEWYHDMTFGTFHTTAVADTMINNRLTTKLVMKGEIMPSSNIPYVYEPDPYFFYDEGDTVFLYDKYISDFIPLYIFNVQPGDTINNSYYSSPTPDKLLVDSVKMVLYDTAFLKTVFTHPLPGSIYPSYCAGCEGAYAKKIGSIKTGFIPNSGNPIPLDPLIQYAKAIVCYHDADYAIKLTPNACAEGLPPTAIRSLAPTADVNISPNPSSSNIVITAGMAIREIVIIGLDGRSQISCKPAIGTKSVDMSTEDLPAGIYIVRLVSISGATRTSKLVVTH